MASPETTFPFPVGFELIREKTDNLVLVDQYKLAMVLLSPPGPVPFVHGGGTGERASAMSRFATDII